MIEAINKSTNNLQQYLVVRQISSNSHSKASPQPKATTLLNLQMRLKDETVSCTVVMLPTYVLP
jgi:hypothetical protein